MVMREMRGMRLKLHGEIRWLAAQVKLRDVTTIIISHRPYPIYWADRVITLSRGEGPSGALAIASAESRSIPYRPPPQIPEKTRSARDPEQKLFFRLLRR